MSTKITSKSIRQLLGSQFHLFGFDYVIESIEPQADWWWRILALTTDPESGDELFVTLVLPSSVVTDL